MSEPRKTTPTPSLLVARASPYRPPRHPAPVDLRLDGNEGAAPRPGILEALTAAGPELLRDYPRPAALEGAIAARLGLPADRVIVTAGGDDAIERLVRATLAPGRELVLPVPTFEMIERYAALAGGAVIPVPWTAGALPVDRMIAAATGRTALIAVVTPNSPTGLAATAGDLARLSAAVPGAVLMVDLAYTEFADEDLTAPALALDNAVAVRSLSKAWGLAGARVGYGAGPRHLIEWMRAAGHPYAVSGPSLALAGRRLERDAPEVERFVARVRAERAELTATIERLGGEATPSQANFVLCRFADAVWVRDALAGLGIAVRIFPDRPELAQCVRITLPGEAALFARVTAALEAALAPEALLFDMDDTLLDASRSYRGATIATAARYGVAVTAQDISRAKAAGDANDDWRLTWSLIRAGGVDAPLPEVTARFEEIYQGTADRPGLRATEELLVDRATLARLAGHVRLGIVTGRPRADAERFLVERGIDDLFAAVVTMDDGPLKPDPAPVRAALARMGASRAILVGDTPDDIRAARGAGVIPVGVVAPGDEPEAARAALFAAGAARVLERVARIEEVLA